MDKEAIIDFIKKEFREGKIRNEMFPMMTKFGIRDYSETVHTVGLNYITAIGRYVDGVTSFRNVLYIHIYKQVITEKE